MKLPNPIVVGWKLGNGIANELQCGSWSMCKVY